MDKKIENFEKYLVKDVSRVWTPEEFFYEMNGEMLKLDLMAPDFLTEATDSQLLNESLALFMMLGVPHLAGKTTLDLLARKYKFAAISSAMIWMKKMGITTRCSVGGSPIRISADKSTKNPKAGDVIFGDFYKALTQERNKPNSPVTIKTKDTNTYSWIVFEDVNKQQSGNRLEFHIDNDADPMRKKCSELTVRVEWKGKEVSAEVGKFANKKTGTGLATMDNNKQQSGQSGEQQKQIGQQTGSAVVPAESFHNKSFLEFLLEADEPNNAASSIEVLDTRSRLPLAQFVSLAMVPGDASGKKFVFDEQYYNLCSDAGKGIVDKPEENEEEVKLYDAEKKPGKRKSYNKKGIIEECWEVDFYGNLDIQSKASLVSRLTKVLLGGVNANIGNIATGFADTLSDKIKYDPRSTPMTPFKFGFVHGDFLVPPVKLKTMYNFPRLVKKNFEAQGNAFVSCAYMPIVKGDVDLTDNALMSIWGVTPGCNRTLSFANNPMKSLTDSTGTPKWFQKEKYYLPVSIEAIDFSGCINLENLKGIPKDVTEEVNLSHTGITYESLEELQDLKTNRLDISYCEKLVWKKENETETSAASGEEEGTASASPEQPTSQSKEVATVNTAGVDKNTKKIGQDKTNVPVKTGT